MMDNPNPFMNIGDLAKPANTLIEKISDAIGGAFRPMQIVRVAKAEAEAEKIRVIAEIDTNELRIRAMKRFILEEEKKQNNMESIALKALPEVTEEARPQEIEDDWITHFFDRCRLISDNDMQTLWARVLSGQANSPGSYSKKALDILANLEKSDAVLFTRLLSFSIRFPDARLGSYPVIYDVRDDFYEDHEIDFEALSHLDSLGLIHYDDGGGIVLQGVDQRPNIYYFDTPMWVELKPAPNTQFKLGDIMPTLAGLQIARVCRPSPINGFIDYLKNRWKRLGYKTEPNTVQSAKDE